MRTFSVFQILSNCVPGGLSEGAGEAASLVEKGSGWDEALGSQSGMELNPVTIASLRAGQSGIPNASLLQTVTFCYRSLKYYVFIVKKKKN